MGTSVPGGLGDGWVWGLGRPWGQHHREASAHRLRGRGRRRVPEADEEPQEEGEKEPVAQPPPSDDTRVESMDISDDGKGPACGVGDLKGPGRSRRWSERASLVSPPEEGAAPQSGSPEVLEEDEAELELQKQLEKGRRLRQLQQLRDGGEKVRGSGGRARAALRPV